MPDLTNLPGKHRSALDEFVGTLASALQANLYSVAVYGSAVRGGLMCALLTSMS